MSRMLIFTCTWGPEAPERAVLPFVAANVAATAGQDATVLCTIDAVWLGVRGSAEGVEASGLPRLGEVLSELVANGGRVWLCGACTKPRGIGEEHLADGVSIVGAARVIEEMATGARAVAFS